MCEQQGGTWSPRQRRTTHITAHSVVSPRSKLSPSSRLPHQIQTASKCWIDRTACLAVEKMPVTLASAPFTHFENCPGVTGGILIQERPRASDRILAIWDFMDRPRSGIATFEGVQHYFECVFDDEADDYSRVYVLKVLPATLEPLVQKRTAIWREWRARFDAGDATLNSHPGLDGSNPRFASLQQTLLSGLAGLPTAARAIPTFFGKRPDMSVAWERIE